VGCSSLSTPAAAGYKILDPMPWDRLAKPLAAAEDALARLDERLSKSPIREGFVARTHFSDACASLWLDGELVHLEDLVLHDALMDVRSPTAELVRAHVVLRARRKLAAAEPGWVLTPAGLESLRGRTSAAARDVAAEDRMGVDNDWEEGDAEWSKSLAAIDAAVARSEKVLAGEAIERRPPADRPSLVYDLDWDEDSRLAEWRRVVEDTKGLPPTLAAIIAADAWAEIEPLQNQSWLGRLLAADLLRGRGKTRSHLTTLCIGLKATPQQRRWMRQPAMRLEVALEALSASADDGLKEHDRLTLARARFERRLAGRRSNSGLPALLELMTATPIASAALIADRLGVSKRAATSLATEFGLREVTGRARYRAWAVG
jgi:hypothetical protein